MKLNGSHSGIRRQFRTEYSLYPRLKFPYNIFTIKYIIFIIVIIIIIIHFACISSSLHFVVIRYNTTEGRGWTGEFYFMFYTKRNYIISCIGILIII